MNSSSAKRGLVVVGMKPTVVVHPEPLTYLAPTAQSEFIVKSPVSP